VESYTSKLLLALGRRHPACIQGQQQATRLWLRVMPMMLWCYD